MINMLLIFQLSSKRSLLISSLLFSGSLTINLKKWNSKKKITYIIQHDKIHVIKNTLSVLTQGFISIKISNFCHTFSIFNIPNNNSTIILITTTYYQIIPDTIWAFDVHYPFKFSVDIRKTVDRFDE